MREKSFLLCFLALLILSISLSAATGDSVDLNFNKYYNYDDLTSAMKKLAKAHPQFLTLRSVGKSYEGRDIWVMIINNPKTGALEHKSAMYIDGNVHGNEIQAAEAALYTIWYLMKYYGKTELATRLVDERAFYILPTVNPDGRAYFFEGLNTMDSSRASKRPYDDDRDGLFDEDGYDDLDGDGEILMMRIRDPNGRWKSDPEDRRIMVRLKPGEQGEYTLLGYEGIDNDGDGRMNEDPPGGFDMNRNWGFNWQPAYVQPGAGEYPFSHPETRAVNRFILTHPNIAAAQSYHNSGGMILRGPGAKNYGEYPVADIRVYDYLGKEGEKMLPGYRYLISYKDLYTVYGGFLDWCYRALGIFAFTNELYQAQQDIDGDGKVTDRERMKWNDLVLLGAGFVDWHKVKHPTYGEIEIGGWRKMTSRIPPSFQLEELCHRNNAFVLFNADNMPLLKFSEAKVTDLGKGVYRVRVSIANNKIIPTRADQAIQNNIGRPDFLKVNGAKLISAGEVAEKFLNKVKPLEVVKNRLALQNGVSGFEKRSFDLIIQGKDRIKIIYDSQKGGYYEKEIELE
jgi:hypothetical protein